MVRFKGVSERNLLAVGDLNIDQEIIIHFSQEIRQMLSRSFYKQMRDFLHSNMHNHNIAAFKKSSVEDH